MRALFGIAILVFAAGVNADCGLNTIQGSYVMSGTITAFIDDDLSLPVEIALLSRVIFDGNGRMLVRNGISGVAGRKVAFFGSGKYSLRSNCVGTATLNMKVGGDPTGVKLNIFVSGGADRPEITAYYTNTDGDNESGLFLMTKIDI